MYLRFLKFLAIKLGYFRSAYVRFGCSNSEDYIEYLRCVSGIHSIGKDCHINKDVRILDPPYTRIGNNVTLSSCTLIGHDASIAVLNRAYGKKLDSVGKIDIRDNVFIGMGAIIMPNTCIGPNAVVAAGAVVTKDVHEGEVVAGVPAKHITTTASLVARLEQKTKQLPWADIIEKRDGAFDKSLEAELVRQRTTYFFPKDNRG